MKKWLAVVLVAFTYALPKSKPEFQGMIVECETRYLSVMYYADDDIPCKNDVCKCWWTCKYGFSTEVVREGDQDKLKAIGCSGNPNEVEMGIK